MVDQLMPKVFQRFDLDLDTLAEMAIENPGRRISGVEFVRTLKAELIPKGYEIFQSGETYAGMPLSIIIGSDIIMSQKAVFYQLAGRFKVPYQSGDYYT